MEKKETQIDGNQFVKLINPNEHANLAFTGCNGCTLCCDGSTYTRAAVLIDELFDTAKLFTVVFLKDNEDLSLQLIYTLGKNIPCPYLDTTAKRCTVYSSVRPRACKTYPFNIKEITSSQNESGTEFVNYSLIFDSRCPGLRESKTGIPVIDSSGKISSGIIKGFIGEGNLRRFKNNVLNTQKFLKLVKELDLVTEEKYVVGISRNPSASSVSSEINSINLFKISEERLANLSSDDVMKIHSNRYFNAIYTHLNSINNLEKLAEIRNASDQVPIDLVTFRMWSKEP